MPDLSRFIFSLICIIVTRPSNIPKLEQLPEDGQPSRLKSPPPPSPSDYLQRVQALRSGLR